MAAGILSIWSKPASSNLIGKGSCWWGRIMLVGKDHAGCGGLVILQKYDFCTKKTQTLHRTDSYVSVRNKNRSRHDVFSPPIQIQRPFSPENCPCRNNTENIPEKKVTGSWFIYDFYYGYKIPAAIYIYIYIYTLLLLLILFPRRATANISDLQP